MKARVIVAASSVSAAIVAGLLLSSWRMVAVPATDPEVGKVITGTIVTPQAVASPPSPPAMFSVSNLQNRTVCLAERGATLTSRSRGFWAPPDCDDVWPGLSAASNWTQNEDGSVTLSSDRGDVVLTLVRGQGFSYEAADGPGADLAWLMLP